MKSVAIAVACALLACGDTPRPVSHPKYGYFSGPTITGTVTSVTAGTGLTGGTIVRSGTIAVDTSTTQSRVSGACTGANAIQTINADGTVTCVAGGGGGGTVTSITEGAGIIATPNPITGTGTIAADTTFLQERVSGTCGAGNAIQVINADGTVTCQAVGSITGSGTTGDLPAWSSSTALGNYSGSTATSCSAGNAVTAAALSAAGVLSTTCSAVPQGTVASVSTTAPITGGPITTSGTIGITLSSNLRTSLSALDLSTAVSMPGSLTIQDIYDTVASQTLASGTVTWTPSAGASYISLTCNVAGTTISTITAPSAGRTIDVTVPSSSGTCTFTSGGNVMTPGGVSFPVVGGESFRIAFGGTNWFLETRGHPTKNCGAGSHFNAVDAAGNITCTADAGGITGTLTSPDLVVATGTSTVGNYAGSSCGAGTAATSIGASGSLTCGITPITGPLTSGKIPKANGTNSLTDSDIDLDNGTSVGLFTGGTTGVYINQNSINFGWSYAANALTGVINAASAANGTTFSRNLAIDDGKGNQIALYTGATKAVEFMGAAQVDGNAVLGASTATTTTVSGHLIGGSTLGTPTSCGTTPSDSGSDMGGIVTVGSGGSSSCTVPFGHSYTNAPACSANFDQTSAPSGSIGVVPTTTGVTFYAAFGAGSKFTFTCVGY